MINLSPPSNRRLHASVLVSQYESNLSGEHIGYAAEKASRDIINRIARDCATMTPLPHLKAHQIDLDCFVLTQKEYTEAVQGAYWQGMHDERKNANKASKDATEKQP